MIVTWVFSLLNAPAEFRVVRAVPSILPAGTSLRTEAQNLDQRITLWDLDVEKITVYNVAIDFWVALSSYIKSRMLLKFHK